jgi:hypothetical protein
MASENKKLEAAIASGDGDRHNIEVPAPDVQEEKTHGGDSDSDEEDDVNMDSEDKPKAAPVIEMVRLGDLVRWLGTWLDRVDLTMWLCWVVVELCVGTNGRRRFGRRLVRRRSDGGDRPGGVYRGGTRPSGGRGQSSQGT